MAKQEESLVLPDSFSVIGADFSLNRPGFSIIKIENNKIVEVRTTSIDNKTKKQNKTRGQILNEIADKIKEICSSVGTDSFFIREASVNNAMFGRRSGTAARTGISEVVGVSDLTLWKEKKLSWFELYPTSIKKLVAGNGKATKEEVSETLNDYVGKIEYSNDDESDATAVAIAWLIKNGKVKQKECDKDKK